MADRLQRIGRQGVAGTTRGTVAQPSRMEDSDDDDENNEAAFSGTLADFHMVITRGGTVAQPSRMKDYWQHQRAMGGTVSDSEDRDDEESSDGAKTPTMIQHNKRCLEEPAYLTEVPEVSKRSCLWCLGPYGKWGGYGFEDCLRAEGHIFCLECFVVLVVDSYRWMVVPKDVQCPLCKRRSNNIWVRDRLCALAGHLPAIMEYSKIKEKAMGLYNSAFGRRWFEPSTVEQEVATERWRIMVSRMEETKELPGDACLGCLGDLSAALFHRGYSLCCAAHKFCVECAIRHKRCHLTAYHPRNSPVVVRDMIVYEVNDEHLEAVKILFNAGEPLEALHDHAALVEASRRSWDYGQPPPT